MRPIQVAIFSAIIGVSLEARSTVPKPKIANLIIRRAESAADCPDAAGFASAVEKILGEDVVDASGGERAGLTLELELSAGSAGYTATLRARGSRSGERRIADIGHTCAGLADAVTVTLALILDDERAARAAAPAVELPVRTKQLPSPSPHDAVWVHGGGGAVVGVMESVAPVLLLGLDLRLDPTLVGFGITWLPEQTQDYPPGRIHVSLLAGYARFCYPFAGTRRSAMAALCAHLSAGSLRGRGEGYSPDRDAARAWIAPGVAVNTSGPLLGTVRWNVESFALIPVHQERFTIEGLGVVHDPAPIGLLIAAGLKTVL